MVGKAVELEYNLRGVAKGTKKDSYAVEMAKRTKAAMDTFQKVAEKVSTPEVKDVLAVASGVKLKLNNEKALTEAADRVAAAAKKLAANYDGSKWTALDPMLPKPNQYKGKASK